MGSTIRGYLHNSAMGFWAPIEGMLSHRSLVRMLIRRDIVERTSGTLLGWLWLLLEPGLQVLLLWFLLDFVLQVRFPGMVSFLEYFLVGMVPWLMMSEVMTSSLTVLSRYGPLYRRTVFPLVLLPVLPFVLSGLVYGVVYTVVVFLLQGAQASLQAPFVILGLLVWLLPVAYGLSVIGLFLKDSLQFVRFLLTFIMYLTPILYMPEMLPDLLRSWQVINPFADLMAMIHGLLQDMPVTSGNVIRPLAIWLVLLGPAWVLFRRSEPHVREAL